MPRRLAMGVLGIGLSVAKHHKDALSVKEAELSLLRRLGASEEHILKAQGNLAITYNQLGRDEEALLLKRDIYSRRLELNGEEDEFALRAANNYAASLRDLRCFEEAKTLLHKIMPVARRVFGNNNETTLRMRKVYARALYSDPGATLDELRKAVRTQEEITRISQRVMGSSHPFTAAIEEDMQNARAALRARETPSRSA